MRSTATKSIVLVTVVALSLIASAGVAAAAEVTEPAGEPADITAGDETQEITGLEVTNTESGAAEVSVYINVSALEEAGVGLDSLNVNVSDEDIQNATLVDQNVDQNDNATTVHLTFDVEDNQTAFTVESMELVQLETTEATDAEDLTYYVAADSVERLGDDSPNESDVASASFSVSADGAGTAETATETDTGEGTATETDAGEGTATETDAGEGTTTETDAGEETATETEMGEDTPTEADGGVEDTPTEVDDGDDGDGGVGEDTPAGTDGDGAGFGVVVALLALLGAVLFARR